MDEPTGGTVYALEAWPGLRAEMLPLLRRHWQEIALDHARVPLDIDEARYADLHEKGALRIVTARRRGALIGYHVAVFGPHLHYASTPHYITDVYYIAPEFRHGMTALRLFQAVDRDACALITPGQVVKLYTAVKLHLDQGALFVHMGYRPTERLYTKVLP